MSWFVYWIYRLWFRIPWYSEKYVKNILAASDMLQAANRQKIKQVEDHNKRLKSEAEIMKREALAARKQAAEAQNLAANCRIELSTLLHNDRRVRELIQSSIQRLTDARPRTMAFMSLQEPSCRIERDYPVQDISMGRTHTDMLIFTVGFALHPEAYVEDVLREVKEIISNQIMRDMAVAFAKQSMLK